jgi:uncharacterized protein YndB with AHSA1/START domain
MISSSDTFEMPMQAFVISRELDAPRELVFRVWTEAGHLANWWGPAGVDIQVEQLELRPGGIFHYKLTSPDGGELWAKFVYRQIVPPERLVYTSAFSNPDGETVRAPFSDTFPLEILNTLTFTEHEGRTLVTLRGVPLDVSKAEQELFESMFESMQEGFGDTFDKLDKYLEQLRA